VEDQDKIMQDRMRMIEQNHIALQRDVQSLTANVSSIATSLKGMEHAIETMADRQITGGKTNWANLAAWAGVLIIVLGLVVYKPLENLSTEVYTHLRDGHPESVISKILADETKLEERLDRKQFQLEKIEERLDRIDTLATSQEQNILSLERDIYTGSMYRSGRPIKTPKGYTTNE